MTGTPAHDHVRFVRPAGLPHQVALWDDVTPNRELAMIGGLGMGKTLALAVKLALISAANAPCLGGLVVPTYPMFDRIHRREWPVLFQQLGADVRVTGAQQPVVQFPWGSELIVYSGEKPEAIVGSNLAFAGMDEPAQQPLEAYERITVRVREPRASLRQIVLTGTPEGLPSWFADRFDLDSVATDVGTGWSRRTIRATQWHPEARHYVGRLRETYGHDEALFRTYARGEFVPLHTGLCYKSFDRTRHVTADVAYTPALPVVVACDFNVDSMRWEILQIHPGRIEVLDEVALGANGSVQEAARAVVDRYAPGRGTKAWHHGEVIVAGDAAGKARTQTGDTCYDVMLPILRAAFHAGVSLRVPAGNPPQRDRVETLNYHLASVAGPGRVVAIHLACRELIADLAQNVWRPGTAEIAKSNTPPESLRTHAADALGYAVWQLAAIQRPSLVATAPTEDAMRYHDPVLEARF